MIVFLKSLLISLIKDGIKIVVDLVREKIEEGRLKKRLKIQIKEIRNDPNRKNRAKRMRDMLS